MKKKLSYSSLLLFLFVSIILSACGRQSEEEAREKKDTRNIVESGELAAVNSEAIVLPRFGRHWWQMRIIGIVEHGEIVETGDSVIQLDPSEIKKFIVERQTQLETQEANLQKLLVDQANRMNDLKSNIQSETATFNLRKIELEASRFESERARKIKELEFEQAKITYNKEMRKVDLNKIINYNDLKIQEIRVQQLESEVKSAYDILPKLTITASHPGVFQIEKNRETRALLKVGDNVYVGNTMAKIPELKYMKVNTFINETDFLKIHTGQEVIVRLDAMPDVSFEGEIAYIGKLCHLKAETNKDKKSRQKVFDVEVNILEPDDRLKPGMTVSCEFVAEK